MREHYELIVIGGGTAGLRTALAAARKGHKTLLVDKSKILGGTCLNNGCIPTKAMLHASRLYSETNELTNFGITLSKRKLDFRKLMSRVHFFINDGQKHIKKSIANNRNLEVIIGKVEFIDQETISVNKKQISADKFILATGSSNKIINIDGLDKIHYLDNQKILSLSKVPKSIVMIGGGYISLEFATFFSDLGSKVTVIEKMPSILSSLDEDVIKVLKDAYERRGIRIITNAVVNKISVIKGIVSISVLTRNKNLTINAEKVFLAIGRTANTANLGLEKAKVEVGKAGNVILNEFLQTSNPNIYAIGDVNGTSMFAHTAKRESNAVLNNIFESKNNVVDYNTIPWAVFTEPSVAGVGLSEKEANRQGIKIGKLKANFSRAGKAAIIDKTSGFVKIIYNKLDNKIIGATIIGNNADNMIHEITALMTAGESIETLKRTVHVHPTISEVMEYLREE